MRIIFFVLILIVFQNGFAQTVHEKIAPLNPIASEKTSGHGYLELVLPSGSIAKSIDPEFGSAQFEDRTPFSYGAGIGVADNNYRGYLGLSFERMGVINFGSEQENLLLLGFKLTVDRTLAPVFTDIYFTGSFQYLPAQGKPLVTGSNEFAPEPGFGAEISIGWISPFSVAFNFGYKGLYKNYSYYRGNPTSGRQDKETASVGYSGIFLTTSIGRH